MLLRPSDATVMELVDLQATALALRESGRYKPHHRRVAHRRLTPEAALFAQKASGNTFNLSCDTASTADRASANEGAKETRETCWQGGTRLPALACRIAPRRCIYVFVSYSPTLARLPDRLSGLAFRTTVARGPQAFVLAPPCRAGYALVCFSLLSD